jgi:hypothetical protein
VQPEFKTYGTVSHPGYQGEVVSVNHQQQLGYLQQQCAHYRRKGKKLQKMC